MILIGGGFDPSRSICRKCATFAASVPLANDDRACGHKNHGRGIADTSHDQHHSNYQRNNSSARLAAQTQICASRRRADLPKSLSPSL